VIGKVRFVQTPNNVLQFAYNPFGQRQIKRTLNDTTYYVHDATGNVMGIYVKDYPKIIAQERPIYGSSRIGILNKYVEFDLAGNFLSKSNSTIGIKEYELSDHLGNVDVVILDRKYYSDYFFLPAFRSMTDYYPFGYPIATRTYSSGYRYGFNGQEKDNEVYGDGNSYTAEYWQYDSRLGRRWNVDPVITFWESPYATFANNPLFFSDVLGDTVRGINEQSAKRVIETIKATFQGTEYTNLRNLFKLNKDGVTMQSIKKEDFDNAVKNLSIEAQELAYGYYLAINSLNVHYVEMVYQIESLSTTGTWFSKKTTGAQIDAKCFGGVNYSSNGNSFSIIVMNSTAIIPDYQGNVTKKNSSAGELLSHEMLGHGLGGSFKSKTRDHEDAIQMTNLYLKVTGNKYYRTGMSHKQNAPALSVVTATSVPSYIRRIPIQFNNIKYENQIKDRNTYPCIIDQARVNGFNMGR
jgi:hypothetical protein